MKHAVEFLMLFLFSMTLLTQATMAQESKPSRKFVAAIDRVMQQQGFRSDEPGAAILILQPGKLHFSKGYGQARLKDTTPITPRTMFELASISKTFTSTAILILQDRGRLSIQDDVRTLLPELPVYHADNPIRIRDLLCHTSGLPEYFDIEDVPRRHKNYWVNADYLDVFSSRKTELKLSFPTGTRYEYCNTNYLLLAMIIERVSKKSYGQFLRDEIFISAGMEHTFVNESPKSVPETHAKGCVRAIGYEWKKKREIWAPEWGVPPDRHEELLIIGDGGIWTNLEDMSRWDVAVRSSQLLKPQTWKSALTPSRTRDGHPLDYGLGWMTYADKNGEVYGYGHDGSWGGFRNSYYRHLTSDRTTVILSNRGSLDTDSLWDALNEVVEQHYGE